MSERCIGCGTEFKVGDATREIIKSKIVEQSPGTVTVPPSKLWGTLHEECFEKSVNLPSVVLDRIKRLGRQSLKLPAKPVSLAKTTKKTAKKSVTA